MAKINILDETTINKIAAGEVVEKPVNVVKELVENAIDAGSSSISVEIKGGGIDYIRITDNGDGIEKSCIPMAFLRHATSKIRSIEDLLDLSSLGFRGEALSSICAVARVELITKTKDSPVGYRYCIEGGREMSFDEAGVPDGTTIIVRDLFFNTPARKKFLKSGASEGNLITELMERLILSHPEISFKYVVSGMLKLKGSGARDTMQDVYSIFGRDVSKGLVEVSFGSENCMITGFAGKPEIARGNRNCEVFFVNNRYVKSSILSSAAEEAYRPFLMQHRFPFCILFLDIPSEYLDVNIHPSKTEIKFADERHVYEWVKSALEEAVTRRELIPEVAAVNEEKKTVIQSPKVEAADVPEPFEIKRTVQYPEKDVSCDKTIIPDNIDLNRKETIPADDFSYEQETLFKKGFLGEENRSSHTVIGQIFNTYWIIEYDGKMYIIDQHAAHEKVIYERLKRQIEGNSITTQMISPPYIFSLSGAEETALSENLDAFIRLGFTIEHFGGREYALTSVPTELFGLSELEYIRSVIDELMESSRVIKPSEVNDRIATMACKAAVKGNMRMTFKEADALIDELLSLDNPYNCPHGRPVIVSFSKAEIEKMFKRIV